jgi:basic amino acid/polyamine antiporter, APA family
MKTTLKKDLGLFSVFAISSGAMISSGLFVIPGIAASQIGPGVIFAYLLSGLLVIPALLSTAELSTAMPRAGGDYFFASRSLGMMFGTIDGIGVWLTLILKASLALVGLGAYLAVYIHLPWQVIAVVSCIVFMFINLIGGKETAKAQIIMISLLFGILLVFVCKGLPKINADYLRPLAPHGWSPLLSVTAFVFVSYIGLTKIASVSEEIKNPEKTIPRGMFLSLFLVMIFYGLSVWIIVGVLPSSVLYTSLTPLYDAGEKVMTTFGGHLISAAAILAFATTANAALLSSTRYLLAMSRDHVVPHQLSRLSKYRTPKNAIYFSSAVMLAILLLAEFEQIVKLASTFQLLIFAVLNLAVIIMRESGIKSYDPGFKSPFYPYTQIAGILITIVLIPEMGFLSSVCTLALLGLGVLWYNLYVRKRIQRPGAVAQMAQRVADRLLIHDAHALGLDKELRNILKEKGLRKGDPFVKMIEKADFLELDPGTTMNSVLQQGSDLLAKNSNISHDLIYGALVQRSNLGETPAEAGIALPHLLLDNVSNFYLVVARSIRGVSFGPNKQNIHALFLLLGDRKNSTQHLRFLAEIARRAENPHFLDRWVSSESLDDLRKLLLENPEDL